MRTFQKIIHYFLIKPKFRIPLFFIYSLIVLSGINYLLKRNLFNDSHELKKLIENFGIEPKYNIIKVKPYCDCRKEILVKEYFDTIYLVDKTIIYYNGTLNKLEAEKQLALIKYLKFIFKIPSSNVFLNPRFTCNLYNELRHGPNQKVISYSIYGTNEGYYNLIDTIGNMSLEFFNDWIIRVYYENLIIKKEFICQNECKHDHIYFCNIHQIPFKTVNTINLFKPNENEINLIKNDMSYVHGMMRRWFPITDDFVDFFNSRDSDSTLIQRERDAVDAWLNGGLWGHANVRSRQSGYNIYQNFIQNNTQSIYNSGNSNPKNSDQFYLSNFVWPLASQNATIHDSYNCKNMMGGEPFPTQRAPDLYCFVSCFYPCCKHIYNQTQRMPICPNECRPKNHPEWERC